jgi:NADH dehydrogenase [ubiquinone] 1 alpha subcomplex assembly factor 7
MNPLAERIARLIEAQGPITIAQFMATCLHDPEYGAYASRNPIGAEGDYVSAPEISQTFGEMCGLWIIQAWHNAGRPERPLIVEMGPGRGTLMRDALRAIAAAVPKFLPAAEVMLVDASPALKSLQQETLNGIPAKISWLSSFAEIPPERPIYLIANEFFDCLPIHQFVKTPQGWCEKVVTVRDGALAIALAQIAVAAPPDAAAAPADGIFETSPAAAAIVEEIAHAIIQRGGAGLIVDYGYDIRRYRETLQAVAHHKHADVLAAPGESDLSAHVDFCALKAAAEKAGATVYGPRGQGDFLVDLGIEVRAQRLVMANPREARTVVDGVKRLIDPKQMGMLFKTLAIAAPGAPVLPGFERGQ